jgi:putative ABC transport system permease protein
MLKNFLLLAFKNFRQRKLFSLINLSGLTVGITCCLMIFLFILHEYSYDDFHRDGKNIYRVMRVSKNNGEDQNIPWLSPPYAAALKNDYPDAVRQVLRINPDNDLISYKQIAFNEKKIYLTDSNFFGFFSFPLLKGDPREVLRDPLSIVMTATTARKYFGNEDPIGKVVDFNKQLKLKVTGIAADAPANSHLDFDMVIPLAHWESMFWMNQWPSNSQFTYVKLDPSVNPERLKQRFPAFMEKYLGKFYRENGMHMDLTIHPLKDIYFEGESPFDPIRHGSRKMVYIFMSIAVLILVIACINFMNMSTARATDRAKEVGLRKVMGAVRRELILQFIFESLLFATLAAVFSLVLLQLLMPAYEGFLGYRLPSWTSNGWVYLFLGAVILVVGILAGSYPALVLSSFSPVDSLKGRLRTGNQGAMFRKGLVVFQFGISVLLIIGVTVVTEQVHYVRTTDLGFTKDQSMIVRLDNNAIAEKRRVFRDQLASDPAVESVCLMSGEPGGFHDFYSFESEGHPGQKLMLNTEFADDEFARTLGLKVIAGRDLSTAYPTDSSSAVLINRKAAEALGYSPEKAIGTWIRNTMVDSTSRKIVGVVEDYHYASLKQPIGPLVISTKNDDRRLALVKLHTSNLQQAIDRIGKIYANMAADYPFEYSFLDQQLDRLYSSEARQEALLRVFSLIAISIACLGLFGLASYTAVKRTKEIGVRKVLGSSAGNIVVLLSKDLLKPVLAGTIVAIPIGYWAMDNWLRGFAYRVHLQWWLFAMAAAAGLLIALLTVSAQALKAAMANPVKSLRVQ